MISHLIADREKSRENGAKLIGTRIHKAIGRQSSSSGNGNVFGLNEQRIGSSSLLLLFSSPPPSSSSSITETQLLYSAHQLSVPFREYVQHGVFMASAAWSTAKTRIEY